MQCGSGTASTSEQWCSLQTDYYNCTHGWVHSSSLFETLQCAAQIQVNALQLCVPISLEHEGERFFCGHHL